MKNFSFLMILMMVLIGCGSGPEQDVIVPPGDLPKKEKPGGDDKVSDIKFSRQSLRVASKNGPVISLRNANGDRLVAGDLGMWFNSEKVNVRLSSAGKAIAADLNNNGEWIAAGVTGVFINGERLEGVRLGSSKSKFSVSINDSGQWIAAGNGSLYINGKRHSLRVMRKDAHTTVDIDNSGQILIVTDNSIWTGQSSAALSSSQ